ncbi:GDSL-type esterase/lipase family protein [Mucilaginibacter sp. AW1-3]
MKKIILVLSLLLNVFFVAKHFYYKKPSHEVKNDSLVTYTFNKVKLISTQKEMFNMMPFSDDDVLFIGDSETAGFPLNEMFGTTKIKNRGIGGNTSYDLLKVVKSLNHIPKTVFAMIGVNDVTNGIPADTTVSNINKVVNELKGRTIYFQSIMPVVDQGNTTKIMAYNAKIKQYCLAHKITYIDLFPHLLGPGLTYDGVHLNGKGYTIWKDQITPYVKPLL